MARLFFAVWPDERAVAELAALAARMATEARGRPVPAGKIHLTLAFLGEVPDERRAAVRRAAAGLRGRGFDLVIDRIGSFRRAGVAWAGASDPPVALLDLQRRLEERLRAAGFALEERPFALHVTLARRIERAVARSTVASIAWRARALTLVRTEPGTGRYVIEEDWALRG